MDVSPLGEFHPPAQQCKDGPPVDGSKPGEHLHNELENHIFFGENHHFEWVKFIISMAIILENRHFELVKFTISMTITMKITTFTGKTHNNNYVSFPWVPCLGGLTSIDPSYCWC